MAGDNQISRRTFFVVSCVAGIAAATEATAVDEATTSLDAILRRALERGVIFRNPAFREAMVGPNLRLCTTPQGKDPLVFELDEYAAFVWREAAQPDQQLSDDALTHGNVEARVSARFPGLDAKAAYAELRGFLDEAEKAGIFLGDDAPQVYMSYEPEWSVAYK